MSNTLVLMPTGRERDGLIEQSGGGDLAGRCELVGFGPVMAAARTAQLVGTRHPDRVILAGIAGTYDPAALSVGQAAVFSRVRLHGVGAGTGTAFQPASALGFPLWSDDRRPGETVGEELGLAGAEAADRLLVTCCAASSSPADVARRLSRFPGALAEDMEGFAVAAACRMCGVPVAIVRGISNEAGDRQAGHWRIAEALQAAWPLVRQLDTMEQWGIR